MPNLTVTEKTFWKERVAARIDRALERIRAQHPSLGERIPREAHAQALDSLGLSAAYAELEALQAQEAQRARRKTKLQRTLMATLRGVPVEEVTDAYSTRYGGALPLPMEVADAITKRQALHQEQLLADDPVGRQIVRLEEERSRLLDCVWLATAPSQWKTLWSKVGMLLGEEPTQWEREALELPPVDSDETPT
jgi:hypothetical protein